MKHRTEKRLNNAEAALEIERLNTELRQAYALLRQARADRDAAQAKLDSIPDAVIRFFSKPATKDERSKKG